ncbi:MAG TPA: hypothetical protein PKI61_00075 [bacterium]|nr:hypothetical protein [bacterium]HPT29447.1 hypothetical protein [bacterium]
MNFVIGLIVVALGVVLVIKTEWFLQNFGRIAWFESKFGAEGGSRLGYKLVGVVFIFFGLLVMTGLIGGFLGWALSPLLKYNT